MQKIGLILILTFFSLTGFAQDLNCIVDVRTDNIQATNKDIFIEMKNAISQFMNQRKWISDKVLQHEKINCNMILNITTYNIDQFSAEVSISSSRPVYGTTYNTPIFNHIDQDFSFQYAPFQTMEYQENANVNTLTTLLAFYANIIVGLDFDSFHPDGGTIYFNKALQLRNMAQNTPGWNAADGRGNKNRYYIIDNILDDRFKPFRSAMYQYHLKGMDVMKDNIEKGREEVYKALEKIRTIQQQLPNSVIFKIFFNAKRQELVSIFQQADAGMKSRAVELLSALDPANRTVYDKIKQN